MTTCIDAKGLWVSKRVLGPVGGKAEGVGIESAWSWMHTQGCQACSCEHTCIVRSQ